VLASVRGVDEAIPTDIDSNVRDSATTGAEEDEVTRL
jgi:hypothetical protein